MTTTHRAPQQRGPLSDAIITAVAQLIDDAQSGSRRDPSHDDIDFEFKRCDLTQADPRAHGQHVGKAKRIRAALSWAVDNELESGEAFVGNFIARIKGYGGFRPTSPNYVGNESIRNAADAFRAEGYELTDDGELRPLLLENLSGMELTEALQAYVRRAQRGIPDAALVTGTGKDLLEATATHILMELFGDYSTRDNFPTLLGQAFVSLGLATPEDKPQPGEPPQKEMERTMFKLGCDINRLRNKEGTGHGRPWLPSVTDAQAGAAVGMMGTVAGLLLETHKETR